MTQHFLSMRTPRTARTTRTARALPARALLALAALLSAPLAASAQDDDDQTAESPNGQGNVLPNLLRVGDRDANDLGETWVNRADCEDDVEVEIEVDDIPSDKATMQMWVGSNCSSIEARDGDENQDCIEITPAIDLNGRVDDVQVLLRARQLIRAAFEIEDCGESSGDAELWFLAVDGSGTDDVAQSDFGVLDLSLDTQPPEAPTSIRGGSGENEIPVSWSVGNNKVQSFEIYVDSTDGSVISDASTPPPSDEDGGAAAPGQTNDMCGTGALREGDLADNVASLRRATEGSPTATRTTLSRNVINGDSAAVAVVAVDEAGNKSPLSAVECVYVVPTTGFKDALAEGGEIPQGCPCAAAGPAQLEGALPIALALGVLAYRRRRRS